MVAFASNPPANVVTTQLCTYGHDRANSLEASKTALTPQSRTGSLRSGRSKRLRSLGGILRGRPGDRSRTRGDSTGVMPNLSFNQTRWQWLLVGARQRGAPVTLIVTAQCLEHRNASSKLRWSCPERCWVARWSFYRQRQLPVSLVLVPAKQ